MANGGTVSQRAHPRQKKVEFHPEKSGETGLRILRNYVDYCVEQR